MHCFKKAGDENLYLRARAYFMADSASQSIIEVKAEMQLAKTKQLHYGSMSKQLLRISKKNLLEREKKSIAQFNECGELFEKFGKKKQAAQCFFSGQSYVLAAKLYQEIKNYKSAGEAYFNLRNYDEAAKLYILANDYVRTIEIYDTCNKFDNILEVIHRFRDIIPEKDKIEYINRYAPLAFEGLVQSIQLQQNIEEGISNKKKPDNS